jgi:dTDP-4-dehydrorhamnose reductase
VEVTPDDEVKCDRSLDSSRFRAQFGYMPPSWGNMVDELAASLENARA